MRDFNKMLHNSNARLKSFPGASVENLDYYVKPTLQQEKPDYVVLHVGINNLLSDHLSKMPDGQIVENIGNIGKKCVDSGVEKVFISGLVISNRVDVDRVNKINSLLHEKCDLLHFIFIDNQNIREQHLWNDGIHLQNQGKVILSNNFANSINN